MQTPTAFMLDYIMICSKESCLHILEGQAEAEVFCMLFQAVWPELFESAHLSIPLVYEMLCRVQGRLLLLDCQSFKLCWKRGLRLQVAKERKQ